MNAPDQLGDATQTLETTLEDRSLSKPGNRKVAPLQGAYAVAAMLHRDQPYYRPLQTMKIILNIGLDVSPSNSPTGGPMTLFAPGVRGAVELKLGHIDSYQEGGSDTEQTAIVAATTKSEDIHEAVGALAAMLMQDAIAYTVDGVGHMAGPKAEEWGPFNPAFFLLSATERMK